MEDCGGGEAGVLVPVVEAELGLEVMMGTFYESS